jgi:hypothetical protein
MILYVNRQTIQDIVARCKAALDVGMGEWGMLLAIFLVAFGAFGLGRLSALEDAKPPVQIIAADEAAAPPAIPAGGYVVAARTGSTYYFPWCSGASRISAANQIWFSSESAAIRAGYHPAKNCKGLAGQ